MIRFLTAGESHGKALVGIIEGLPSQLEIDLDELFFQMKRRKLGYGRGFRQKIETDEVEILSGVRHGKTLGSPISLLIWNRDWENWKETMGVESIEGIASRQVTIPRPGHADYIGGVKYKHTDLRNVLERASARETAMRVALGAVCRQFLEVLGVSIGSRVTQIGSVKDLTDFEFSVSQMNSKADESVVRCIDSLAEEKMVGEIETARVKGDSVGGVFEVWGDGLPKGLGSYSQWDRRLESSIGQSFLSLNAIKGVEIGAGFSLAENYGSHVHDPLSIKKEKVALDSNFSGGITGGMSTGQPIVVRAAMKPIATLKNPLESVNLKNMKAASAHVERSDVCAVPAAAVIGESLLALSLSQFILEKFGGDSIDEIHERVREWNEKS